MKKKRSFFRKSKKGGTTDKREGKRAKPTILGGERQYPSGEELSPLVPLISFGRGEGENGPKLKPENSS